VTTAEFVSIMGGITALIVAVTALVVQVVAYHRVVNSRMTELLALTAKSAHAEGLLDSSVPPALLVDAPTRPS
jgi:hypothetical protein